MEPLGLLERLDAGFGSDQAPYSVLPVVPIASHALAVADTEPQTELTAEVEEGCHQSFEIRYDLVLRFERHMVMQIVVSLPGFAVVATLLLAVVAGHA